MVQVTLFRYIVCQLDRNTKRVGMVTRLICFLIYYYYYLGVQ